MHETAEAANSYVRRQWADFGLLAEPAEASDTATDVGCIASGAAWTFGAQLEDIIATAIALTAKHSALHAVAQIPQTVLAYEVTDRTTALELQAFCTVADLSAFVSITALRETVAVDFVEAVEFIGHPVDFEIFDFVAAEHNESDGCRNAHAANRHSTAVLAKRLSGVDQSAAVGLRWVSVS